MAGRPLPVCARDTGIYVGFLVAYVLISILERDHPREMPPWQVLALCGVFVAAMGLDGVTSYAGIRPTNNDIRLLTGLLCGFALPPIVLGMLNFQLWREPAAAKVLASRAHQVLWLAAIPVAFALMRFPLDALAPVYTTLTIVGVFGAFTSVNLVIVSLFPMVERRAVRGLDLVAPILVASALTVAELAAAGWLHAVALRPVG